LGQIKNKVIKNLAKTLIEKYPDRFSTDFENNKEETDKIILLKSKKIRNKVAGYLVHEIRKKEAPPREFRPQVEDKRKGRRRKRR
jgi:small subunit ribosomal protein S17e